MFSHTYLPFWLHTLYAKLSPHPSHALNSVEIFREFHDAVEHVASLDVPTPAASSFRFEFTNEAAEHNSALMAKHDYDLTRVIASQQGTVMSYRSEFRPVDQLDPLLQHHPNWQHV